MGGWGAIVGVNEGWGVSQEKVVASATTLLPIPAALGTNRIGHVHICSHTYMHPHQPICPQSLLEVCSQVGI